MINLIKKVHTVLIYFKTHLITVFLQIYFADSTPLMMSLSFSVGFYFPQTFEIFVITRVIFAL